MIRQCISIISANLIFNIAHTCDYIVHDRFRNITEKRSNYIPTCGENAFFTSLETHFAPIFLHSVIKSWPTAQQ